MQTQAVCPLKGKIKSKHVQRWKNKILPKNWEFTYKTQNREKKYHLNQV